jgi:ABC-type antimicrobial peptide transport system permease subunit
MSSALSNEEILKRVREKYRRVRFLTGIGLLGLLLAMLFGTLGVLTLEINVAYQPYRFIYSISPAVLVGFAVGIALFLISVLALKLCREVS